MRTGGFTGSAMAQKLNLNSLARYRIKRKGALRQPSRILISHYKGLVSSGNGGNVFRQCLSPFMAGPNSHSRYMPELHGRHLFNGVDLGEHCRRPTDRLCSRHAQREQSPRGRPSTRHALIIVKPGWKALNYRCGRCPDPAECGIRMPGKTPKPHIFCLWPT